jgi:hypothetical protein
MVQRCAFPSFGEESVQEETTVSFMDRTVINWNDKLKPSSKYSDMKLVKRPKDAEPKRNHRVRVIEDVRTEVLSEVEGEVDIPSKLDY